MMTDTLSHHITNTKFKLLN